MARCFSCKNEISQKFVEALGHQWHPEHFACVICHRPFGDGQFFEHDNQPYCEKDYYETFGKRCLGCGEPIRGDYINALGGSWHSQHLVCTICRQPFGNKGFLERDGQPYCEHDFYDRFGKHCAVCGEPMHGTYLIGGWGEAFCKHHESELPQCFSCNRMICEKLTGGGVEYQDGRHICNICRKTAINDQEHARLLFGEVQKIMLSYGIRLESPERLPLRLAGLDEIDRLAGGTPAIEAGITLTVVTTCGEQEVSRAVKEVVILYGLPKDHTMSVMAHELGHVWCFMHGFPELAQKVKEGLCQLFAYLCLAKRDTAEAQFQMKAIADNLDPEYGDGFRQAHKAMSNGSLEELLERVRKNGSL